MTTSVQKAILLDLHPSPSSSPSSSSLSNHTGHLHPSPSFPNSAKEKVHDLLLNNASPCDVIQLYILTSSSVDVSSAAEQLAQEQVDVTVVEADARVASFYKAKQKLDALEIADVTLLCEPREERFWSLVCQELFTPVHTWGIKSVQPGNVRTQTTTKKNPDYTNTDDLIICPDRSTRDDFSADSSKRPSRVESSPDPEPTAAWVRAEIKRVLQALPSLLGRPEVERSRLLPGRGQGFVHGYSTRRGGVTSLPTLCAMNVMYTDKKRDPLPVVEENLRRLSLAGGFDPQTFHIVRVEHGHRVWSVGEEERPLKYDALVTNRCDVTLAAAGADCIPLLFADPLARVIGAAHAGWMGSVDRIAACVVRTMGERFGSRPEDIRVSLGPGLRLGCFKVLEEDGKMFADIHPSCQTDSVETVRHTLDKASLQRTDSGSLEILAERPDPHVAVPDGVSTTSKEGLEPRKRGDRGERPGRETPGPGTKILDEASKRTSSSPWTTVDSENDSVTSLSRRLLDQLKVEHVPAEDLRPKIPRPPRNAQRKWTFVDLQMANYHALLQAGVKAEHIDLSTSHCTKCNPDLYFSYERDGFPFGNQIGFICMPSGKSA